MMMQNFNDAETIVSPAIPAIIAKAPHTDKIRISPMRWRALHASIRVTPAVSAQPLQPAMQSVFMETTTWFHGHLDEAMGPWLASALQRIHDAGQGLFVGHNVLFVSLRQVAKSPAGYDARVTNAVQLAEQALLSRIMQ